MSKNTVLRTFLILLALILVFPFGCKEKQASAPSDGSPDSAPQSSGPAAQAAPAKASAQAQKGKLNAELLNEYDLAASATGYSFLPDDRIELSVSASNDSGHPGTIWVGFSSINGWDVSDHSQAVTILQLAPGESQTLPVVFDLSGETGKAMDIQYLTSLSLSCEGYLDSTQYEYYARMTELEFESEQAQTFGSQFHMLTDNEYLELGILPESESYAVLYLNVKTPVEDGKLELYPIEGGNFNASLYPMPYSYSLGTAGRKVISISSFGFSASHPDGFGIIYRGIPLASECVLQNNPGVSISSETVLASGNTLEIDYSNEENLLYAHSLDSSRCLLLAIDSVWIRDGVELKSNPLSLPVFPGTSTSFRISGRGVGADGVARSFQYDSSTQSASASFPVYDLDASGQKADPIEIIRLDIP